MGFMKVTFLLGALVSCDGRRVSSVNTSFFSSSCMIFCLSSGGVKTESFLASRRLYLIVISNSMLFCSSYSSVTKGDVPPHSSINGSSYVTFVNSFLPSYRRSSVVFSFSSTRCFNLAVSARRNGGEGGYKLIHSWVSALQILINLLTDIPVHDNAHRRGAPTLPVFYEGMPGNKVGGDEPGQNARYKPN